MNKDEVVLFWRRFFTDLLLGTFVNLVLFSASGFCLGMSVWHAMDSFFMEELDWSGWVEWSVLIFSFAWYAGFGILHGLAACAVHTTGKKISEAVAGIHGLLDLLTRGMVEKIPRFNKNIPRDRLEETFDGIGKNFLEQLRLKKGITAFFSRILFGAILKALKFFFLDDVVEELTKKESGDITSSDIEHAVRRVGVEVVMSPILENFFLLHLLNFILLLLTFGIPVGMFYFF
ncbi:hypothetical protein UR09_06710 [Candidatus Nitromaritima sp. SCGC AAA799-A02]|nr:hypothetical protein UR09_06710 [Candidatus Nitromaritima sp. SCGC AAA799-A02]KMP12320.1 hypothetical protein UZ36_00990 [Candidatus Nitromaritima sp. SCGC AAA799-C22]